MVYCFFNFRFTKSVFSPYIPPNFRWWFSSIVLQMVLLTQS